MDLYIEELNETGELTTIYVQTHSNGNQRIDVIVSSVLSMRGDLGTKNDVLPDRRLIVPVEVTRETRKAMVSHPWSLLASWVPTQRDERLHEVRDIHMQ